MYYEKRKSGRRTLRHDKRWQRWYVPVHSKRKNNQCDEIIPGDLIALCRKGSGPLGMTAGLAYPFSKFSKDYIASIADYFLGVSNDGSYDGDEDKIVVSTSGAFEFDCPSSVITVGMYAGARAGTNSIEGQKVSLSQTSSADCLGTVRKEEARATDVLVQIQSKIAHLETDTN